jgi:hypothetical protein
MAEGHIGKAGGDIEGSYMIYLGSFGQTRQEPRYEWVVCVPSYCRSCSPQSALVHEIGIDLASELRSLVSKLNRNGNIRYFEYNTSFDTK